jgi:hypothetical protein
MTRDFRSKKEEILHIADTQNIKKQDLLDLFFLRYEQSQIKKFGICTDARKYANYKCNSAVIDKLVKQKFIKINRYGFLERLK